MPGTRYLYIHLLLYFDVVKYLLPARLTAGLTLGNLLPKAVVTRGLPFSPRAQALTFCRACTGFSVLSPALRLLVGFSSFFSRLPTVSLSHAPGDGRRQ